MELLMDRTASEQRKYQSQFTFIEASKWWVWTRKAEAINPRHSKAGEKILEPYLHKAPECWVWVHLIIL